MFLVKGGLHWGYLAPNVLDRILAERWLKEIVLPFILLGILELNASSTRDWLQQLGCAVLASLCLIVTICEMDIIIASSLVGSIK